MIDTIVNVVSYVLLALAVITAIIETLGYFGVLLATIAGVPDAEECKVSILPLILFIGAALAKYIANWAC